MAGREFVVVVGKGWAEYQKQDFVLKCRGGLTEAQERGSFKRKLQR